MATTSARRSPRRWQARATGSAPDWLPRLEASVQHHPRDAALAYAVGTVFAERQLWGKARQLLEQAAGDDGARLGACAAKLGATLARIADEEGDGDRAAAYHRSAAEVA